MTSTFTRKYAAHLCTGLLCLTLAGCKPDAAIRKGEVVGAGPKALQYDPAPNAATLGTITGTAQFTGTAPQRIPIDMSQDPDCAFSGQNLS